MDSETRRLGIQAKQRASRMLTVHTVEPQAVFSIGALYHSAASNGQDRPRSDARLHSTSAVGVHEEMVGRLPVLILPRDGSGSNSLASTELSC